MRQCEWKEEDAIISYLDKAQMTQKWECQWGMLFSKLMTKNLLDQVLLG